MLYEGADTLFMRTKHSECSYILLPQGAKIDIPLAHYALGGGATNVGVGLKKLGFEVEAFFRTGNDATGCSIKEKLAHDGISTTYCTTDNEHGTAISVIIPSQEHDHVALCYRAANRNQKKEDFPLALLEEIDLLYLGPLGGQSQELLPYLAPRAHAAGVTVALNPSMIQLTHDTLELTESLRYCDILVVNTAESGYLMQALLQQKKQPVFYYRQLDQPALLQDYLSFNNTDTSFSLRAIAKLILKSGPQTIVITNGAEGVYVVTAETIYFHPSIPTSPVYSLGAGDAFNSGFLGALSLGVPLEKALIYGILNASSVIQHPDAKQGLLSLEILEQKAENMGTKLVQTYAL